MSDALYAIFGAAGCGRGIMPLLREQVALDSRASSCIFIDDSVSQPYLNGHRVLCWDEFLGEPAKHKLAAIAVANSTIRERLFDRCAKAAVDLLSVRASNAVEMDEVTIGEGYLLSPFVTLTSNITIGRGFHANLYSYVEHDCLIGNFVTFAPRVMCNGNVHIEDHAYIGSGAVIKQGKPGAPLVIGRGATVGMGAVVTKSVPPNVTVVGNPARIVERK